MYPKFQVSNDKWKVVESECGDLLYVQSFEPTQKGQEDQNCRKEIAGKVGRIRYIHNNEDDHALYHRDNLDRENIHYHLHFHKMITHEQLEQILNILVKHDMMESHERAEFLKTFDQRYAEARQMLDKQLNFQSTSESKDIARPQKKKTDTPLIIDFIKSCADNDILVDLHNYLEMDKFRYLRELTESNLKKRWQGTNALDQVVETSESWAVIEKALTLQMAHNIEVNCSRFSKKLQKISQPKWQKTTDFFL